LPYLSDRNGAKKVPKLFLIKKSEVHVVRAYVFGYGVCRKEEEGGGRRGYGGRILLIR
jgi:hypothetical protein